MEIDPLTKALVTPSIWKTHAMSVQPVAPHDAGDMRHDDLGERAAVDLEHDRRVAGQVGRGRRRARHPLFQLVERDHGLGPGLADERVHRPPPYAAAAPDAPSGGTNS